MLNLFPILWLTPLGHTILRVVVGGLFLYLARHQAAHFSSIAPKLNLPMVRNGRIVLTIFIILKLVIGGLFILGLYTQLAALLALSLSIKTLFWHKRFPESYMFSKSTYVLLIAASLSLLVTGSGPLGFDLPI